MQTIRALKVLSMGILFFLIGCGGTPIGSPPATTPAVNPTPAVDMAPAPAQTATAASFTTSNLTVTPDKAKPGDMVMVGVTVANTGTQQGTYSVVARDHEGTLLGTKDVTLAGGAKENVTLYVTMNATGTYMIMIDMLYQNLVIQDAAAATPLVPPPPPPPGSMGGMGGMGGM